MRILYFSNANNYHTIKWCRYFCSLGYEVHVATLEPCTNEEMLSISGVRIHWLENAAKCRGNEIQKVAYFTTVRKARKLIEKLNPEVVHAHYATSYGLICSLACTCPYYLSVWGSDVYSFPKKSFLHKRLLEHSLNQCTWLMSTSEAMAEEASKYTNKKDIFITPFGVDMRLFNPINKTVKNKSNSIIIGTVKALENKYGIDILIKAIALLRDSQPNLDIRLRIAGKGSKESELKALSSTLGLDGQVEWLGYISQEDAAFEWANFDIAVVPSYEESFGVSAVEAQACGTPIVITDVPGLVEVCDGGRTALVVPCGDVIMLANALEKLVNTPSLRARMANAGRLYVENRYELHACFERINAIYASNLGLR